MFGLLRSTPTKPAQKDAEAAKLEEALTKNLDAYYHSKLE